MCWSLFCRRRRRRCGRRRLDSPNQEQETANQKQLEKMFVVLLAAKGTHTAERCNK